MRERPHVRGQALVEFAVALPILILLVAGVLELGRGYACAMAVSDAARDGARYASGKTAATDGPGLANICALITADLASVTTNVSCPNQVFSLPPSFTAPTGGQAVVVVYCGSILPSDCVGTPYRVYETEIDVYIEYGFNDLNLFGGLITISGSSKATTSW
jgi:hypothetical protein